MTRKALAQASTVNTIAPASSRVSRRDGGVAEDDGIPDGAGTFCVLTAER
ncbi:hypothetical protein GCM10027515_32170 [Schumannella luteola]